MSRSGLLACQLLAWLLAGSVVTLGVTPASPGPTFNTKPKTSDSESKPEADQPKPPAVSEQQAPAKPPSWQTKPSVPPTPQPVKPAPAPEIKPPPKPPSWNAKPPAEPKPPAPPSTGPQPGTGSPPNPPQWNLRHPPPPPPSGGTPGTNSGGPPGTTPGGQRPPPRPPSGGHSGGIWTHPGPGVPGHYAPPPDPRYRDGWYPRGGYWFYDRWGNLYYYDGYRPPLPADIYYGYPRYAPYYSDPDWRSELQPAPRYRDEEFAQPGSVEAAAADISRAWEREEFSYLLRHLRLGWRVRFYDGPEYTHALAPDAFREVTEGVWATIRTREYQLRVLRVLPGGDWAVLRGSHTYTAKAGEETILHVRYLLRRDAAGAWIIREITLSDRPL